MKHFLHNTTIALVLGLGLTLALLWVLSSSPSIVSANPGDLFVVPITRWSECTMERPCSLQTALSKAVDGDTIYLAKGTYTGSGGAVVTLTKNVNLHGGWNGSVSEIPVRDPDTYPSTMDGEGQRRVVYIDGSISPTLDGLIITGGNASDAPAHPRRGGGIYGSDAAPIISNNVISDNVACINCTDDGAGGGGIRLSDAFATVLISGNVIVSNTANTGKKGWGGGLGTDNSDITLIGNVILSNTASTGGSGYGGGLVISDHGVVRISDNTIQGNTASKGGGGEGGGLHIDAGDATLMSGNTIQGNTASTTGSGTGGGVYIDDGDATLDGNVIVGNRATLSPSAYGWGGGVWMGADAFTMTNTIVADNRANTQGGGLWLMGESPAEPISGQLLHTTIADNGSTGPLKGSDSRQGVFVGDHATLAFTTRSSPATPR